MNSVEIIIPAYNEGQRIAATLHAWLEKAPTTYTVTVVMNGCTDNTRKIIESVNNTYTRKAKILEYPESIGKGGAIIRGWKQSSADIVGFVDADLSTSPEEMMKLVNALENHDGVIASRFMRGATIVDRQSPLRTLMSKIFALCVKVLFGMPFSDTQCGAKVFTRSSVLPLLDTVTSTNMAFDVELLWRLYEKSADVIEIPTYWIDQKGSASLHSPFSLLTTGLRMLRSLIHVRFS